jgi:protein-S-isoprenylcysteine O-methyltransferase Ste14
MMVGMPLALDSYWGLVVIVPGLIVLAYRILDEEKMLTKNWPDTREYTQKVHQRLVPYVW